MRLHSGEMHLLSCRNVLDLFRQGVAEPRGRTIQRSRLRAERFSGSRRRRRASGSLSTPALSSSSRVGDEREFTKSEAAREPSVSRGGDRDRRVHQGAFEALRIWYRSCSGLAAHYSYPNSDCRSPSTHDRRSLFLQNSFGARCAIQVREAEDKELIEPGVAYFAPARLSSACRGR